MPAKWTGEIIGGLHNLGLNAKDLAAHMGLHPKYVSKVLNGRRQPKNAEARYRRALHELASRQGKTAWRHGAPKRPGQEGKSQPRQEERRGVP